MPGRGSLPRLPACTFYISYIPSFFPLPFQLPVLTLVHKGIPHINVVVAMPEHVETSPAVVPAEGGFLILVCEPRMVASVSFVEGAGHIDTMNPIADITEIAKNIIGTHTSKKNIAIDSLSFADSKMLEIRSSW